MAEIALIWAMDRQGVIGAGNRLPWRLPADMRWFRRQTMGKPLLMGRRTFESFGARPLPGRRNLVLSRDPGYEVLPPAERVGSVAEGIAAAGEAAELMVIGGAQLYAACLPLARRLYLTRVEARCEGDVYFPHWNPHEWREVWREPVPADAENPHPCTFLILERADPGAAGP